MTDSYEKRRDRAAEAWLKENVTHLDEKELRYLIEQDKSLTYRTFKAGWDQGRADRDAEMQEAQGYIEGQDKKIERLERELAEANAARDTWMRHCELTYPAKIALLTAENAELRHEVDRLNVAWKEDAQILKEYEAEIEKLRDAHEVRRLTKELEELKASYTPEEMCALADSVVNQKEGVANSFLEQELARTVKRLTAENERYRKQHEGCMLLAETCDKRGAKLEKLREALGADRSDDWMRIQDAEREAEKLRAKLEKAEAHITMQGEALMECQRQYNALAEERDEWKARAEALAEALGYLVNTTGCDQSGCVLKWRKPVEALAEYEKFKEKK